MKFVAGEVCDWCIVWLVWCIPGEVCDWCGVWLVWFIAGEVCGWCGVWLGTDGISVLAFDK